MSIMRGFLALVAITTMAVGFSAAARANCADTYNGHYGQGAGHKAFAMTVPGSALSVPKYAKGYSCGWAIDQPTVNLAVRMAMVNCESTRIRADRAGRCRIVAKK